ncbi:MAG: CapA family protein [Acidobacteria bacterium]|nr:CapA family protein [Acidobacteriota bacterium]
MTIFLFFKKMFGVSGDVNALNRMPVFVLVALSLVFSAACGKPAPEPAANKIAKVEVKPAAANFIAVGDMMISRVVARAIDRAGNPLYPFQKVGDLLKASDFSFGNLESPISGDDTRVGKGLVFNTRVRDVAGLSEYKFKIVNLANNHAWDQGMKGLVNTHKYLDERGIKYIGTGENLERAWKPEVVEANGIKFGFVGASYASINDGGVKRNDYVARIEETEFLERSIKQAKAESDFVVVTMHAGIEYVRKPHQPQIDFARKAIDFGADIVIGAHPHWIQTTETYKGKMIFYSLGNFIFDQRKPDTREGLMLKISVRRGPDGQGGGLTAVERIDLIPVIIDDFAVPRPANDVETAAILKKIGYTERFIVPGK